MHHALHPKSEIDRLYLPRAKEDRGGETNCGEKNIWLE